MRRVAVTGLGIISSIGNGKDAVARSLREGRSGMRFLPEMQEMGYRCCVYAPVSEPDVSVIPKKALRTMAPVAQYGAVAAYEALADSGMTADDLRGARTSIVVGTGMAGVSEVTRAELMAEQHVNLSRCGGNGPVKIMNSTVSGHLAVCFGTTGREYSLSAACATGLYNIGHAYELIKFGLADMCVCGGAEEDTWRTVGASGENTSAMPIGYNDRPTEACRPYDRDRQGFVISAGSGIVILETLERAQLRGAKIYAEMVGYGASNDGGDIYTFQPQGDGLRMAIEQAYGSAREMGVDRIDYVNPHGVGSTVGDAHDVRVLSSLFGDGPMVSSTKSLAGHAMGAVAGQEVVYTLLMMERGFVSATANLQNVAEDCRGVRHVQAVHEGPIQAALVCNSGLGGSNAAVVFRKV